MINKIKICPFCHYLGDEGDDVCPHCGVGLISECPKCGAPIKTPFAEYCSICGANFKEEINKKQEVRSRRQE